MRKNSSDFSTLAGDEAHMADAAVGEAVDDGPPQPFGEVVVGKSAKVGIDGGKHNDQNKVHAAARGHGFTGCGRHNHLGGKGINELSMAMKRVTTQ